MKLSDLTQCVETLSNSSHLTSYVHQ